MMQFVLGQKARRRIAGIDWKNDVLKRLKPFNAENYKIF